MPDDYYVSQYSGEEIDALLGKAGSSVQVACNPNLLDNWYFGNPVNQRGQTEYTAPGYSVDRWWFDNDSNAATINLTNDGIKFSAIDSATGVSSISQIIPPEVLTALAGKTITLSAYGKTDTTQQVLFLVNGQVVGANSSAAVDGVCLTSTTYTFPDVLTSASAFIYGRSTPGIGEGTILAVKLELGSQQTLAHKDASGNWILNEIPDNGEQLRRCQRYLFSANKEEYPYACIGSGFISANGKRAVIVVPLPVTLRAVPACTVIGRIRIDTSYGEIVFVKSMAVYNIGCGSICVYGEIEGTATANAPCYALLESNANNLLLSANF